MGTEKEKNNMKKLNSKKYPDVTYEEGEDTYLSSGEFYLPFSFDVEAALTEGDAAMTAVAKALDEVDDYEKIAKAYLKAVLANEEDENYGEVSYFMEFHRDEVDPDTAAKLFPIDDPSALTFAEMVDYLRLNRFGSFLDDGSQGFIMDLCFNPEITDELMVIYFNADKQIVNVAHES